MGGHSSKGPAQTLELREVLHTEHKPLKNVPFRAVKVDDPQMQLMIHDLVCHCDFCDDMEPSGGTTSSIQGATTH